MRRPAVQPLVVLPRSVLSPCLPCSLPALSFSARFLRPSAVLGVIEPLEGFVSQDIRVNHNQRIGGQYGRAVYARRHIPYGIEIINVPAFAMYVGDEPVRHQCLKVAEEIYQKMASDHPHKPWIFSRVMTLMSGGQGFFFRERDCEEFADGVKLPDGRTGLAYLHSGEFTTTELQKLPQIVNFNKWEVEYRGRKGVCLFPEATYFSHDCDPNVTIEIRYSADKNRFVLSARTCKPVNEGEQLFINYMPGNTLPLSRLSRKMNERWGFECLCARCRSRLINAMGAIAILICIPGFFLMQMYLGYRGTKAYRNL
jgi:hypothetical protein